MQNCLDFTIHGHGHSHGFYRSFQNCYLSSNSRGNCQSLNYHLLVVSEIWILGPWEFHGKFHGNSMGRINPVHWENLERRYWYWHLVLHVLHTNYMVWHFVQSLKNALASPDLKLSVALVHLWRFLGYLLVDHSELYTRIPLKCGQNTSPKMVKTYPPKWSNHVRSLDNECCPTSDSLCVLAPRECSTCKMYLFYILLEV